MAAQQPAAFVTTDWVAEHLNDPNVRLLEVDVDTYCRIAERSSDTWFVLHELLGYPSVRNYDGSWTKYGSVVGVPIDNPSAAIR